MNQQLPARPVGVFDIDGTIFRSGLLLEIIRRLIEKNIFPSTAWDSIAPAKMAWKNRTGSYQDYLMAAVRVHEAFIAGTLVRDIRRIDSEIIFLLSQRVYRYPRTLITQLKSRDYYLVAISGSPSHIVKLFAERMGFNTYRAAEFEDDGTAFTGRCQNPQIWTDKSQEFENLLASLPFPIDFANSYVIGDTEPDIPMLSRVGHPIAFNPNTGLAAHAAKEGWPIVIERKDVIAELHHGSYKFLTLS